MTERIVVTPGQKEITQALTDLDRIQADIRKRTTVSEPVAQTGSPSLQTRVEMSTEYPSLRERRPYFVR